MIEFLDECSSTQKIIIEGLKNKTIQAPYALASKNQTLGVGSRGNSWEGGDGNLYFSFCIDEKEISKDIPSQSISIYFAMIMREILSSKNSKIWVKWPNDFYIDDKKIGGVITNKISDIYICGMGINLVKSPKYAAVLDIGIDIKDTIFEFFELIEEKISWKQIFSKFVIEFKKSRNFCSHIEGQKLSLQDAKLCEDGALVINNKKVYSLR